jgi:hypothetical protein
MNNLFSRFTQPSGTPASPASSPTPLPYGSVTSPSAPASLTPEEQALVTESCSTFNKAISSIVVAARESSSAAASPWQEQLLLLLSPSAPPLSTLLSFASHPSFPPLTQPLDLLPHLLHTLRLLRVLSSCSPPPSAPLPLEPLANLISPLLTSVSTGELLRPHLPSLLALISSPYNVHGSSIPPFLSPLLTKFTRNCISRTLALHLHDRSCVPNMLL